MRGDLKVSLNMADRCQLISAREDCFAIDSAISPVANQRLEPSSKALEPKIIRLCHRQGTVCQNLSYSDISDHYLSGKAVACLP